MRGIRYRVFSGTVSRGISPAHAGNTLVGAAAVRERADQPRTCGEYEPSGRGSGARLGSAPHMRGIHRAPDDRPREGGISPAHAGNTGVSGRPYGGCGDQPRTCGEYPQAYSSGCDLMGSAPHMRGIPIGGVERALQRRISPAHAGNTASAAPSRLRDADQPRTCGEYATV